MMKLKVLLFFLLATPLHAIAWNYFEPEVDTLSGYTIHAVYNDADDLAVYCYDYGAEGKDLTINFEDDYREEKIARYYGKNTDLEVAFVINGSAAVYAEGSTYTDAEGFYALTTQQAITVLTQGGQIEFMASLPSGEQLIRHQLHFPQDNEGYLTDLLRFCQ